MIFVDTCILIDNSKNKIILTDTDKKELREFNKILKNLNTAHIDQEIMNLSVQLMNQYGLSHGMGIYDSIIASTCLIYDLPLWTHNKKDFKFLDIELV